MKEMYVYHVVTERPMYLGQKIIFNESHHNGVYDRVYKQLDTVKDIYVHPEKYNSDTLEHHTRVALRELALEEVRLQRYPEYPSRLSCLYVSKTLVEAKKWADLFIDWKRPTYAIVKLKVEGNSFVGDANNCFQATIQQEENLLLANRYWKNLPNLQGEKPIQEVLVNGDIEVIKMVKEINANI